MNKTEKQLIETNVTALQEGLAVLGVIDDSQYTHSFQPIFQSTIGAHFRHVIEHYQCFLQQLKSRVLCYDNRCRTLDLEVNRGLAEKVLKAITQDLRVIDSSDFAAQYAVCDMQCDGTEVVTSLSRELLFLQSHTVHHYAIIAAMSRIEGLDLKNNFGVAIATRAFHSGMSTTQEVTQCAQ